MAYAVVYMLSINIFIQTKFSKAYPRDNETSRSNKYYEQFHYHVGEPY